MTYEQEEIVTLDKCAFEANTIDLAPETCKQPVTNRVYLGENGEEGWVPACAGHYDAFVEAVSDYTEPKEPGERYDNEWFQGERYDRNWYSKSQREKIKQLAASLPADKLEPALEALELVEVGRQSEKKAA